MDAFLSGLNLVWSFLLSSAAIVFNLFTTVPVLAAILALWVLDRIFGIFKLIKG